MSSAHGHFPEWVRSAVFYQIFPDRFAKSGRLTKPGNLEGWYDEPTIHGYKGGDLLGVAENLDYLTDLGVNALYLCPVFASGSNHRYHTHDYFQVDPLLGGNDALDELITAAHTKGVRVVLDGVFNHASRGLLQFHDLLENGHQSPYVDWFHVNDFPLNAYGGGPLGYDAWWGLPALPKFNTSNPAVREFLWSVAEFWLKRGIDGWRLDVPNEIDDDDFWREFRRRCRAINPDAYLVGEIWDEAGRWLKGDIFDGVMNYQLNRAILGLVAKDLAHDELARSGLNGIHPLSTDAFASTASQLLAAYPEQAVYSQLNLLGSHDTPRVLTGLKGDTAALKQALLLLFSWPGAPCVYYGDEIGLLGGHDPGCRAGMPWARRELWNEELRGHVRSLAAARHELAALRYGATKVTAPAPGVVMVQRLLEGAPSARAIVNLTEDTVALPLGVLPDGRYRDLLSGTAMQQRRGQPLVPARSGLLLTAHD